MFVALLPGRTGDSLVREAGLLRYPARCLVADLGSPDDPGQTERFDAPFGERTDGGRRVAAVTSVRCHAEADLGGVRELTRRIDPEIREPHAVVVGVGDGEQGTVAEQP